MTVSAIKQGDILKTPKFDEPMRVINEPRGGNDYLLVDLVGLRTKAFRGGVFFTAADLQHIEIEAGETGFQGSAKLFLLGLEALRIRLAYEYDPFFGLSISRVDPLPHQLDAVYNHMLKAWRCRFLLADDAGAGKTIMAGLLLKELKLRGLVERTLIICPANLSFQWRRELRDRFEENFELYDRLPAPGSLCGQRLEPARSDHYLHGFGQAGLCIAQRAAGRGLGPGHRGRSAPHVSPGCRS